ncbi:MAG: hypothetical protein ACT4PZ_21840 [Panacagrimonas sp.]
MDPDDPCEDDPGEGMAPREEPCAPEPALFEDEEPWEPDEGEDDDEDDDDPDSEDDFEPDCEPDDGLPDDGLPDDELEEGEGDPEGEDEEEDSPPHPARISRPAGTAQCLKAQRITVFMERSPSRASAKSRRRWTPVQP